MIAVNSNLQDLWQNFFYLQEILNISESLKIHVIFYHYDEYFEQTGETFLGVSDEITESVHSRKDTPMLVTRKERKVIDLNNTKVLFILIV